MEEEVLDNQEITNIEETDYTYFIFAAIIIAVIVVIWLVIYIFGEEEGTSLLTELLRNRSVSVLDR